MTPKTLITIVTEASLDLPTLDVSMGLAKSLDAHLDVIALGVNRLDAGFAYAELSVSLLQSGLTEAQDAATRVSDAVKTKLSTDPDLRSSVDTVVAPADALAPVLARKLRFADLAILPRPYGGALGINEVDVIECALFNASLPVLILPPELKEWDAPKRVIMAWNESNESLKAARAGVPIMEHANTTFVTVIDPPTHGLDRSDPGGLLSQMLARHGVRCEVDVLAKSLPRVSDVILRHSVDRDADMLVMGAYGRARWSEAMFGGATRQMLEDTTMPVLMAH